MRNLKKYLTVLMAMLLALCMLLSSCVNQLPETPDENTTPNNEEPITPAPTECTHANTTLVGKKDTSCAAEGYTGDQVCTACGAVVTAGSAIAKTEHTWDGGVQTKDPTCIEQGVTTFTCTGCGETKSTPIDCVDHDHRYHDMLDGTHNITCSTCTKNENKEHEALDNGTFVPKTCLEDAYTLHTCALCEASYKVYSTAAEDQASGHTWGEWVVTDATCSAVGSKTHTCVNCPESETVEIPVDPNAHNYIRQNPDDKPTCVDAVTAHYACEHCHATKDEEIPATGRHNYELQEDQGDGWTRQICSVCGDEIAKYSAENDTRAQMKAEDLANVDTAFEVNTQKADIQFPQEVVSQMTGTANADIAISADTVTPEAKETVLENATNLTPEQKDRLADVEIYDFGVTVNDQPLSDKDNPFAAPVTVTMHYELKPGEDPDGIVIWYVQNDGTIEEVEATYDAETETVTFAVDHFSFYAVAYKETQEMKCKKGNHLDVPTDTVVPASCEHYGYTVYQCSCCLRTTIDEIVDRTPHSYGEIIPAHPTCTEGDYSTRECSACHDVITVEYFRATGHTPDGVATCTKASTCTTCNEVITPAKGHNFTEWKIIIEPTDVNPGLRRRHCTACGTIEEVKLAATGNITEIEFESYQEMLETVFAETLNLKNGVISLVCTTPEMTYDISLKVNEEGESYIMLLEMKGIVEGETVGTISALYRNGVLIFTDTEGNVLNSDLESLIYLPYEVFVDYLNQTFDLINPMVEAYLEQVRLLLAEYTELYGADINSVLAAVGSEYTVEELSKVLDALETVYTYAALKLGFDTNLSMHDGVKIPTRNDYLTVVGALMTATESEGKTTYTWNVSELMEAANAVVAVLEEYNAKALTEVIYDMIGATVRESYPELTDWAACEAKFREAFPGTTTVQDLIDMVITVLETNEICTLEELYAMIDEAVEAETGEEFSCAEVVEMYADVTLNDLIAEKYGEGVTVEDFYDEISEMLSETTYGSLPVVINGQEMTMTQLTAGLKQALAMIDLEAEFSFSVDEKGYLLGMNLGGAFGMFMPDSNGNLSTESTPMISIQMAITHDDTVKVEIPEILQPAADQNVSAIYDANGNLVISGLDVDFEYNFSIYGYNQFKLSDVLKLDEEMSAELGYNVYVTDEILWNENLPMQYLVKVDGNYYTTEHTWTDGYYVYGESYKWDDIKSGALDICPNDGQEPVGYYRYYDEALATEVEIPVYSTILGIIYQMDGEWRLATGYGTRREYPDDKEAGPEDYIDYYSINESAALADVLELIEISTVSKAGDYYDKEGNGEAVIGGVSRDLLSVILDFDGDGVDFNREYIGYLENDELYLVERSWVSGKYGNKLVPATLQEGYDWIDEWESTIEILNETTGEIEILNVTRVETYKRVPTYYAHVAGDFYTRVYNLVEANVSGLSTMTLPDGNILYVRGTTSDLKYCRENGCEAAYGYVAISENVYVWTFCFYRGDQILDVEYYNVQSSLYTNYNSVVDINDYLTENGDGTYTVAAELFTLLKGWATKPGDSYSIEILGEMVQGETKYQSGFRVGTYMVPDEVSLGNSYQNGSADEGIDWWYWFGKQDTPDGYGYTVSVNENGDLVFTLKGQSNINVNYRVEDQFPADGFLSHDAIESAKYQLNIYNYKTEYHDYERYVQKDGKYYDYGEYGVVAFTFADDLDDMIANHWNIQNMYYRYTTVPSEEYPEPMRVYYGFVGFGDPHSNNGSLSCYFTFMDGKLYVLKQAVEKGESELKYEAMVPASEYFASLLVEVNPYGYSYIYDTVYYNGVRATIFGQSVYVYETDENGNKLTDENGFTTTKEVTLRSVVVDGKTEYIVNSSYTGSHMELRDEMTLEDGYDSLTSTEQTYDNGTFTKVEARYTKYNYHNYVKLADRFYDLYDSWESYESQKMTHEDFMYQFADEVWFYGVRENGTWTYYSEITYDYENSCYVLSGEMENVPKLDNASDLGYDANGNLVCEFSGYLLDETRVTVTELEDGTVLYSKDGTHFLKGQDGYYVPAKVEILEDGTEGVICMLRGAYVNGYDIESLGVLDDYITISQDDGTVTVSREVLEIMRDHSYSFNFWIDTDGGRQYYFNYYDLDNYFMQYGGSDDGTTDDGKTEDGKTEEGTTEDGKTEDDYVEVLPEDGKTEDGTTEDGKTEDGYVEVLPEDGKTEEGTTEDGKTEDGKTEDGYVEVLPEDGKTEDGTTEDGTTEDGKTEDGYVEVLPEDGKTEDGTTEDGKTEDGKTEDGYVEVLPEDGKTEDGTIEDEVIEDGVYEDVTTEESKTEDGIYEDVTTEESKTDKEYAPAA